MPNGLETELSTMRAQIALLQRELADKQRQLDLANEFFRRVRDLVSVFDTKIS